MDRGAGWSYRLTESPVDGVHRPLRRRRARKGFIHPDDLAHTLGAWEHGFATGSPIQIERRFQRADGEYRWHISRCLPMRDAAAEPVNENETIGMKVY